MSEERLFPTGNKSAAPDMGAAQEELRGRLPDLRNLPGFPNGSDEDILRMSLPPYYTACPNPFIEEWLKESAPEGYGDELYEDPGPFAADISVGKSHPIYKAHSYPTKVPHEAIMRYILHYTHPGDVVLDGFAGTGMAGVAAQACGAPEANVKAEIELELGKVRWGTRRAILQDLSPAATFIAAGLNLPIDAEAFDRRSQEILEEFDAEWGWMYETTHKDGRTGKIDYTVWSEVFTCPHCGGEVVFYEAAFNESSGKVKETFPCPSCGAGVSKTVLQRRKVRVRTLATDTIDRIEFRPVRIKYRVGNARHEKTPDEADLALLGRIQAARKPWFPTDKMPVEQLWHGYNFGPRGLQNEHHLFSDRALTALAVLWSKCSSEPDPVVRLSLVFWVEQAIWGLSWMNRYQPLQQGRLGGSQVNRQMTGVYYFPSLSAECSPRYNLEGSSPKRGKRSNLARMWAQSPAEFGEVVISTSSSSRILLPNESADYVFVDPPFGLNIPYLDLALLVEYWHRVTGAPEEEAVVHRVRGRDLLEYQALLESCFAEFFRVLKPGRWMTVEFNNSSNAVWMALQEAMLRAGFMVADTRILDKQQGSWIQVRRPNAVKRDIIISAYKPAAELEERFSLVAGSEEGAWEFIREHLRHLPLAEGKRGESQAARERMADRLYDRMVAYHVHRGYAPPLSVGEFYVGLEQRFPVRDQMYFLPDQVEAYERFRLTIKELLQADLFITNESSALQWLRQLLKAKPRTFAEIQPGFFAELQAGLPEWENLPDLRQLLDENCLQDEQGRWYVPDPKKATDLERLRSRALLKEYGSYVEGKGKLEKFRSEAVRAGFREAWAGRDFGMIVKVGDRLPADAFTEDEQLLYYYDAARRLRS
jgi:DNA modification methylase